MDDEKVWEVLRWAFDVVLMKSDIRTCGRGKS
jgi:hypothetical protein